MANPCIEKFFPELSTRHEQLVKEGLSDREAAIKAALEQHEKLFKDLEVSRAFTARSRSDKDNILSGFRAYVKYIKWTKEK